jgi:YfiH family protein
MAEPHDMQPAQALSELERRMDAAARPWMSARALAGLPVLEASLPGLFRACFTTRLGGDSHGAFASLNLDGRSEDDPDSVARNRARLADAIGRRLVSPSQVHGVRVTGLSEYVLESPDTPCDGLTIHQDIDKTLAAALLFADCVPVVLCGEVDMAVAHGGWRGILGGVVQQAGRSMMGAPATAVIGPSIGPCCFTVGEEVADSFARRYGSEVVLGRASEEGGLRVDLWEAVAKAASELGVQRRHVVNPRLCTVCNRDLFYSYRREGPVTGRHACLGWIADA